MPPTLSNGIGREWRTIPSASGPRSRGGSRTATQHSEEPTVMATSKGDSERPSIPSGINHLVLNVRDLEESHRFWTEIVGFKQVGELKPTAQRPNPPRMRFYSGDRE